MMTRLLALALALALAPVFAQQAPQWAAARTLATAAPAATLDPAIPSERQEIIVKTFARVAQLASGLILPEKVEVKMAQGDVSFDGAATDIEKETIVLTKMALDLSPASFEALIAHELTHVIVAANFHVSSDRKTSLLDYIKSGKDKDSFGGAVLGMAHLPYGEFLCDLMAVIETGNLGALAGMMAEIEKLAAKDPVLAKHAEKWFQDQPKELSVRDFKIAHTDPRWASYAPKDGNYNRFNQIRAYLGTRWLSQLPPEKHPQLFAAVLKFLDPIFMNQQFDYLISVQGLASANQMLVAALEQNLSAALNAH